MSPDEFTRARLEWIEAIATSPDVSPLAVRCGVLLATRYVNRKLALDTGKLWAWPSQETLAGLLNATRQGIAKAIATAENAGFLRLASGQGRGRSSRYLLIRPSLETQTGVDVFPTQNANDCWPFGPPETQTVVAEKANRRPLKSPTGVCTTPVKEPVGNNPASRGFEETLQRAMKALPVACRERSNETQIREAIRLLAAEGLDLKGVTIAIERFCTTSETATENREYLRNQGSEKGRAYLASLGIGSAEAFGQWHWNQYGKNEGRTPYASGGIMDRPITLGESGIGGEAGPEGILPLANVGGEMGVRASLPDTSAIVAALEGLHQELTAVKRELAAGNSQRGAAATATIEKLDDISDGLAAVNKSVRAA